MSTSPGKRPTRYTTSTVRASAPIRKIRKFRVSAPPSGSRHVILADRQSAFYKYCAEDRVLQYVFEQKSGADMVKTGFFSADEVGMAEAASIAAPAAADASAVRERVVRHEVLTR